MDNLQASISIGMTKQVRSFEPVNVHISIQNVTKDTTKEQVSELLDAKVSELAQVIGSWLAKHVNAKVQELRGDEI